MNRAASVPPADVRRIAGRKPSGVTPPRYQRCCAGASYAWPVEALGPDSVIARTPTQVSAGVQGDVVILELEHGMYFGVNDVGAAGGQGIAEPRRVEDICDEIHSMFDVEPARCRTDVLDFLQHLE